MIFKNVITIEKIEGFNDSKTLKPIKESFLCRNINKQEITIYGTSENNIEVNRNIKHNMVVENAYYGGVKINHFGHFILESLSRLYKLKNSGFKTVVWFNLYGDIKFQKWQLEVFKLLGLEDFEHIVLTKDESVLIQNIMLIEPGYVISNSFLSEHADFLSVVESQPIKNKKIWLSRNNIEGAWVNECEIENILVHNGWEIYHPELFSLEEQIKKLSTAEIIAGTEGSAFHLLVFIKEIKSKVIIFSRRSQDNSNGNRINENYFLIESTKKLNQFVYYPRQIHLSAEGIKAKYIVNTKEVVEALGYKSDGCCDYFSIFLEFRTSISTIGEVLPERYADLFRDSAVKMEKDNLKSAFELMSLAQKIRPSGLVIKQKLKEYKEILAK